MADHDAGFRWHSAGATDRGRSRSYNQDAFLDRPDLGLWAVADGMGGHQDGERASRLLVEGLASLPRPRLLGVGAAAVNWVLRDINRRLVEEAEALGEDVVIGSTIVALLAVAGHCAIIWVGDSRVYRLREGSLSRLTRDHTEVQLLVDQGLLAPEQAALHPSANVLVRAIGADLVVEIDTRLEPLQAGDRYLLCSDGLDKELTDPEIASLLAGGDPGAASRSLVQGALEAGGRDNITVLVVDFLGRGAGP